MMGMSTAKSSGAMDGASTFLQNTAAGFMGGAAALVAAPAIGAMQGGVAGGFLGVGAGIVGLIKAYYKKALKCHPDRTRTTPAAAEFQKIGAAYQAATTTLADDLSKTPFGATLLTVVGGACESRAKRFVGSQFEKAQMSLNESVAETKTGFSLLGDMSRAMGAASSAAQSEQAAAQAGQQAETKAAVPTYAADKSDPGLIVDAPHVMIVETYGIFDVSYFTRAAPERVARSGRAA
ncbi:hypothetical protein JL721_13084 [Aureococcus anophagefferens]|nr:hypothetical protein JL721_13084 [Aureococcus anophagefferens]